MTFQEITLPPSARITRAATSYSRYGRKLQSKRQTVATVTSNGVFMASSEWTISDSADKASAIASTEDRHIAGSAPVSRVIIHVTQIRRPIKLTKCSNENCDELANDR